jgi:hypothetical protein
MIDPRSLAGTAGTLASTARRKWRDQSALKTHIRSECGEGYELDRRACGARQRLWLKFPSVQRGCMRRFFVLATIVPLAAAFGQAGARAETTPPQPASAQPSLPRPIQGIELPSSGVAGGGSNGGHKGALTVHKHAAARMRHHRHVASGLEEPVERPALAGVTLVQPIPHPNQPPHFTVPVPAYPLENIAGFYITPPPPVICHRVRRDPDAPDPHLYREVPVVCEADNP